MRSPPHPVRPVEVGQPAPDFSSRVEAPHDRLQRRFDEFVRVTDHDIRELRLALISVSEERQSFAIILDRAEELLAPRRPWYVRFWFWMADGFARPQPGIGIDQHF